MKIVHLSLCSPYTDNWGYQENVLPRVQYRQGHDVTIIVTCTKFNSKGEVVPADEGRYTLDDGVKVIRFPMSKKYHNSKLQKLLTPYNILPVLRELKPELLFVHNLGAHIANYEIRKYIRQAGKTCVLVSDNHMFNELDHAPKTLKSKLIRAIQAPMKKVLIPFCKIIFGITPDCIEYAKSVYGISEEKLKLLPLGFDTALCKWEQRDAIRRDFRVSHGINEDDIVIIHGGKIEKRRRTPETINSVKKLNNPRIKLVVFGGISEEMKHEVEHLFNENKKFVIYLGKLNAQDYYNAYLSSDVALFPGGQSVLWQEAIGCGLPLVVGNAKNIDYLNRGGNIVFVQGDSTDDITANIKAVLTNDKYKEMANVASTAGRDFFSYERIAESIIDYITD